LTHFWGYLVGKAQYPWVPILFVLGNQLNTQLTASSIYQEIYRSQLGGEEEAA
jgi:hypothetical protein